ncbi:epithelial chloride channel protein-like protein [Dinothrombium tinctorium]|uniref:Epithelial chloride channel protein-like protein n=1 Tax=Dinothrombium tinctorium TaxID=1965070 RepID=A0A3S3P8Z8_9ACAR|nr:epithelial chloride channel protein-like protein [Dinothrombium tinctorium]
MYPFRIEIIGHGIGAHVDGQIGKHLQKFRMNKLKRIIGLDPAALWFKNEMNSSLQCDDAENVTVIHTNSGGYGIDTKICLNDLYLNDGQQQPECKNNLIDVLCSHNVAWDRYIDLIEEKSLEKYKSCNTFVLCLDFSGSMFEVVTKNYLKMMNAAKELIRTFSDIKLGIVSFGGTAVETHPIVEINTNRENLISSIVDDNLGSTSIGGGLRRSLNMLISALKNEKCSANIILATDGEQNTGETPADVLPDLLKLQVKVSTLAIGTDASPDLEEIAKSTGGQVFYVNDDEAALSAISSMHRNLLSLVEKELDVDKVPIYVTCRNVFLGNNSRVEEKVLIDPGIGKDTTFEVFIKDKKKIGVCIQSPNKKEYTEKSPEYDKKTTENMHSFRFKIADSGDYIVTLEKKKRFKRFVDPLDRLAVTLSVKSFPKANVTETVQLVGKLSNRVLTYPHPIRVFVELGVGKFPIINATVVTVIEGDGKEVTIKLHDNGRSPDLAPNDGIYSGTIWELPAAGRNSIVVKASSSGEALLLLKENNLFKIGNTCSKSNCQIIYPFERELNLGSVKKEAPIEPTSEENILVDPITDLEIKEVNDKESKVTLQWTIPGNSGHNKSIEYFEMIILTNATSFENGYKIEPMDVIGSLNCTNCLEGMSKNVTIKIPKQIWSQYINGKSDIIFAVKSILSSVESDYSNLIALEQRLTKLRPHTNCFYSYLT